MAKWTEEQTNAQMDGHMPSIVMSLADFAGGDNN